MLKSNNDLHRDSSESMGREGYNLPAPNSIKISHKKMAAQISCFLTTEYTQPLDWKILSKI